MNQTRIENPRTMSMPSRGSIGALASVAVLLLPVLASAQPPGGPPGQGQGPGPWQSNGDDIFYLEGNVGIGTMSPTSRLFVGEVGTGPSSTLVLRRSEPGSGSFQNVVFRLDPTDSLFQLDVGGTGNSRARIHLGDLEQPHNPVTTLGNVGIGTLSPETKLDVEGTTRATALELRAGGNVVSLRADAQRQVLVEADDPALVIRDTTGADSRSAARIDLLERSSGGSDRGAVFFWDGESDKLRIGTTRNNAFRQAITVDDSTGRVGVGTDAPEADLDVEGRTRTNRLEQHAVLGDKISLFGGRFDELDMYGFGVAPNTLYYKSNGNHSWFIRSEVTRVPSMNLNADGLFVEGNVGIGTTSPERKLHVVDDELGQLRLQATDPANDVVLITSARGTSDGTHRGEIGTMSSHDVVLFANGEVRLSIGSDGNVCLGACGGTP